MEELLFKKYRGFEPSSEIEPSKELIEFICNNFMSLSLKFPCASDLCDSCGNSTKIYCVEENMPFSQFVELEDINHIELEFCGICKEWKLDFVG